MRLGIDMGTNSLGWWLYRQNDTGEIIGTIASGVRIFSDGRDPKSKASLAVARREARAMRRRRDRFLRRRASLMRKLAEADLLPSDPLEAKSLEARDVYELRARGLDEKLTPHEIGRVLFHLNQRRGFKSNRKTDGRDNEGGKIKEGAARLEQDMQAAGARSYGEFLAMRRRGAKNDREMPQIRTRMGTIRLEDKNVSGYPHYPTRALLEDEFRKICAKQASFHPELLTDDLVASLFETVFYQRPLKEPEIGLCLYENERRLAKAHPIFQERRLYETINALRIREAGLSDRALTKDERDALILLARGKKKVTFASLRKALKLRPDQAFTHESGNRKDIEGDEIRAALGAKKCFGSAWVEFDHDQQWEIIQHLKKAENHDELVAWLEAEFALDRERAEAIANAKLPEGYGRIGLTASRKILAELKADVVTYAEAAALAGYHHSDERTGEVFEKLPYYGEVLQRHVIPGSHDPSKHDPVKNAPEYWGRITNPTVHIALGQLRHVVNDIIDAYGLPNEMVVELARDLKNSEKQKAEINRKIAANTKEAIRRGEALAQFDEKLDTGANRAKMRIWEGLNSDLLKRVCPYCCQPIGIESLFDGSTDIDHILPYSRTMDDGIANKVVAHAHCNRDKRNKTPFEAWGHLPIWQDIAANVKNLPAGAQWRFGPDAMERFEGERNFEARQLTDTQYLARITLAYLKTLYPEKGAKSGHVWAVPGRLTEMLRRKWDLNDVLEDAEFHDVTKKKNRQDHRHHAIDAAVIGATDRGLVNKIAKASGRSEEEGKGAAAKAEMPYDGFRADIIENARQIITSHKQDHGTIKAGNSQQSTAQLHNDTAYGITGDKTLKGVDIVVSRKPFMDLSEKDIGKIRDQDLLSLLFDATRDLSGKEFTAALEKFRQTNTPYQNIRRVRIMENLNVIPIHDASGNAYKGYKGDSNFCVEIWRMPEGDWKSEVLTTFDAHNKGLGSTRPHPAAKLVTRLYRGDVVMMDHPKAQNVPMIIAKMSAARLDLFPPNEANVDARDRDKNGNFSYVRVSLTTFQKYKLRKVGVDRLGHVRDPGFLAD